MSGKSERLKYQGMSRSISRASWGEEVSSPRVGTTLSDYRECSALAIPTPRFVIFCFVSMTFVSDFSFQFDFGAHPLAMDTIAENARGGNTRACPSSRDYARAYPPVRARKLTP
jgi:hypothetical protein